MERCPILHPCAACRIQRRKCGETCLLAPYFPPQYPEKFLIAHNDVPAEKRADAVSSMVYKASARLKNPVYGCTGIVCQLQKQVLHLQSELMNTSAKLEFLLAECCNTAETESTSSVMQNKLQGNDVNAHDMIVLEDVGDPFCLWKPL